MQILIMGGKHDGLRVDVGETPLNKILLDDEEYSLANFQSHSLYLAQDVEEDEILGALIYGYMRRS